MVLHNYTRRRSHNNITFAEFDRNFNFISNDILPDVIACSGSHVNYSVCRMNFVRNEIVVSLMKQ